MEIELKFYDSMTNVLLIKVTDIMSLTNHLKGEKAFFQNPLTDKYHPREVPYA